MDDENVILTSLRDQLTHHLGDNYTIELAESGEEALEVLEELLLEGVEVPLIISDQIMPGMKGDELLIRIHSRYPRTLKIFLTGQADANAVGNAVNAANLYRYIAKPWDEADLKLTVTKALCSYFQEKQILEQTKLLEKLYAQAQEEITERRRMESLLAESNQTLEERVRERTRELSQAIEELRDMQNQLIVQEKMASLGMLTAGIAHEIKNPLNFINSFAALSLDLLEDIRNAIRSQRETRDEAAYQNMNENLDELKSNIANIHEEGQRADSIIRSMLIHSHGSSGKPRDVDLNTLLSEAVNLTCHSMRSKDRYFDIKIETAYDPDIEPIRVIPQDISRVIVNLINNAYHATSRKKETSKNSYVPAFSIQTQNKSDQVEIRVRDNGIGIPDHMKSEIFNPFFSTKPSGEGAGLGLSISYDIIVRGHQGTIDVDTEEGQYTEFVIRLPKKSEK